MTYKNKAKMSRSRKKAIVKDITYRKKDYWKIHRRVNKQIVKFFYKSATHRTSCYDSWDDYFEYRRKFEEQGYSEEEASIMASYEVEDNEDFPICSNFHQDWGEEPNIKNPKELINDYDYCDYKFKVEFYNNNEWLFWDETEDDLKNLKEQYRRK